jgi:hypothetical protein
MNSKTILENTDSNNVNKTNLCINANISKKEELPNLYVFNHPNSSYSTLSHNKTNKNESLLEKQVFSPSIQHSQSAGYLLEKSTKHISLNDSHEYQPSYKLKRFKLPKIEFQKCVDEITNKLLSPKRSNELKHTSYKKKPILNFVREKAYSQKILHLLPGNKLTAEETLKKCFGSNMLKNEGYNKVKFIMEHRNYRDIDLVNWDYKKTLDAKNNFDFETRKNFYFSFQDKKKLIKYNTIPKNFSISQEKRSFDENVLFRLKSCQMILKDADKKNQQVNNYKKYFQFNNNLNNM